VYAIQAGTQAFKDVSNMLVANVEKRHELASEAAVMDLSRPRFRPTGIAGRGMLPTRLSYSSPFAGWLSAMRNIDTYYQMRSDKRGTCSDWFDIS
jgi:hypothetical protein